MKINFDELKEFLVKAKVNTYAGDGKEIVSQRPDFKELEFSEGDWYYRDSYTGFYQAPGQEIVRFKGEVVWAMAYSGGMKRKFFNKPDFTKQIFNFLKKCLEQVNKEIPYRGPLNFKEGDYDYINKVKGNIKEFTGCEKILYQGKVVFKQSYIGGLVIPKE